MRARCTDIVAAFLLIAPATQGVAHAIDFDYWTNNSGTVDIVNTQCDWTEPNNSNVAYCSVPDGYVLVGGGGEVKGNGQAGAMLTMSTPTNGLKSWLAASSDHQIPYVHQLRAYAIGMRVRMSPNGNFLPEDKLRSQMYIRWAADTVATGHHSLTATLSGAPEYQPGDLMVGGGAYVSTWGGAGQLLVSSLPIGVTGWAAESKDHGIVASAQLGIGLIGMRRCPAGTTRCFNMKVQIDPPGGAWEETGYRLLIGSPIDGRAMTSVGVQIAYNGAGRMPTQIVVDRGFGYGGVTIMTKDHVYIDTARAYAYTLALVDEFDP